MSDVERITVQADSDVLAAWKNTLSIVVDKSLPTCAELCEMTGRSETSMRRQLRLMIQSGECQREDGFRIGSNGNPAKVTVYRLAQPTTTAAKRKKGGAT